jgi:hypothetical protein
VVRNAEQGGPKVLWMNLSGRYVHYTDYLCSIKMDRPAVTHQKGQGNGAP